MITEDKVTENFCIMQDTTVDDPFELIMQRVLEQSHKRFVEQKDLETKVEVTVNGKGRPISLKTEGGYQGGAAWVLHRNVGYLFPQSGELTVTRRTQQGSWYDINHSHSNDTLAHEVLTLSLNHGVCPTQGKYAYIVLPDMRNIQKLKKYWKNNPLEEVTIHLADPQQKQQEIHQAPQKIDILCMQIGIR